MARALAERLRAVHLRIDTIEQALRHAGITDGEIGPAGYMAAYELAADNLRNGLSVIADSVNPLPVSRDAWRAVAERLAVDAVEIEITCSDAAEHRRRVETRRADITGLVLPSWQDVATRDYAPWSRPRLVVDTAGKSIVACLDEIVARLKRQ